MQYQQLGQSDLQISTLSLGCMSFHDQEIGQGLIHTALDHGINFFDTADLYDRGENEKILGQVLKGKRKEVIIATKVGNQWREDGSGWDWNPSKAYIKSAVKESLRRLQTDYIDLYQLHGGTIDDPIEETIEAFEELKSEGWIRYYGISSIRPNVIRAFGEESSIVSNMMQYSLLDRRPEEFALDFLAEKGVSVLVRGGLAKGLLANKPARPYLSHTLETVQQTQQALTALKTSNVQAAHLALAYCWRQAVVASTVVGASSIEQLIENIEAIKIHPIHDSTYDHLASVSPLLQYENHR